MKTHMLEADQVSEFIFTRDWNETWNEADMNCKYTDDMEIWWSQLYLQFKQLRILASKKRDWDQEIIKVRE